MHQRQLRDATDPMRGDTLALRFKDGDKEQAVAINE
jgi:hypothetical protein